MNLSPITLYREVFSQIEWHGRPAREITRKMRVPHQIKGTAAQANFIDTQRGRVLQVGGPNQAQKKS